jgi:hypothetical protein
MYTREAGKLRKELRAYPDVKYHKYLPSYPKPRVP